MGGHPASDTLRRAIASYREGRVRQALALAEASFRQLEEIPGDPPEKGMVASWYGLLLATVAKRGHDGLRLCRLGADLAFWEPRAFLHLARVELEFGTRPAALAALDRGLALAPDHRELRELRSRLGFRRPPPLRFLDRSHPLNRVVGRWIAGRQRGERAS